jgi:uncharacterized membrane protein YhaH (DUF805 family)
MSFHTPPPAAGWYRDPAGAAYERWWDGGHWSSATRPVPHATPAGAAPPPYVPAPSAYGAATSGGYPPAAAAAPIGAWRSPIDNRPFVQGMGDAVRTVFAKYATFDGRATRPEYWWFYLFTFLVTFGAYILLLIPYLNILVGIALFGWGIALIVPTLALTVRRLRDAGLHWAWLFISFVPFGGIALIVMLCQPSKHP